MKPTLDMAVAAGMDLGTACDIISDNVSALGLDISQTTELVDKMAATSSNSNTTIEMMGEAFKYCAPVANTLGVDVTSLSAAIGVLGNNGIKAGQAGNVLKNGLARLSAPTKEMQKTMDKYNISLQKNEDGSVDLLGTVEHLKDKIGGLDKVTQAQALSILFGKESMSGWASLINTSTKDVQDLANTIENSNGAASDMAEIMSDNLEGSIKSMKSAFEGVMITVGDMFIPIMKDVVDSVTGVLRKFNEMSPGSQKLIIALGATAAATGPLMLGIGKVGGAIMKVVPLMSSMASGMGITLSASTVLVGGLVALGVAFVGLLGWMGSSSEMISYLQTEFGAFGTFLSYLGEFIYGTFQLTFGNIGILLKTLGKMLMALMKGDFKEVGNIWKDGWAEMSNNTAEAMSNINMETARATEKLRSMTAQEMDELKNNYSTTMESLKTVTHDNMDSVADTFVNQFKNMDDKSITLMKGTSDTMAILLEGISSNMSDDAMHKKFVANLEDMVRGGKLSLDELDADTQAFIKTLELNFNQGSNQVSNAGKNLWENFKNVSTRGIGEVSTSIAEDVKNMDSNTFAVLQSMGGSWAQVFDGITDNTSMSTEEMAKAIKKNYEAMGMSSEEVMKAMEQDMNFYMASQELANATLSESSQKMVNDVSNIYSNLSSTTTDNVNVIADAVMTTVDGMALGSVEKLQGMGTGFSQVFSGIKEDGSMTSEQMKAKVIENLNSMLEQGVPIAELMKTDMTTFMSDMAAEGEAKSKELKDGVTTNFSDLAANAGVEISSLPPEVQEQLAQAGVIATEGSNQVKQNIVDGVSGTTEGVKSNVDISNTVLEEVNNAATNAQNSTAIKDNIVASLDTLSPEARAKLQAIPDNVNVSIVEATAAAAGASQIKDTIVSQTAGVSTGVQANMAGMTTAVDSTTSQAKSRGVSNTAEMVSGINSQTALLNGFVGGNMAGMFNAVSMNTSKAKSTADTDTKAMKSAVDKNTKDIAKNADKNFKEVSNSSKSNMQNAAKSAKQAATDMYNGVRTSFSKMASQGSSSASTLKDSVINSTAIMKNSAIKFWGQIRDEYSKTIKGKIEVTRTVTEEKKTIYTTVNKNEDGKAAMATIVSKSFAVDESEMANRQLAVATLSRLRSNDTISIVDKNKKGKTSEEKREENSREKSNTYITNNYTSPKAMSLLELKKQAKRESRKLGVSFR